MAAAAQAEGSVVRISTGQVAMSSLKSFVQTYRLMVLPAYQSSGGFLSARLLVGAVEDSAAASGAGDAGAASASSFGQKPPTVTVQSITEWANDVSFLASVQSPAYTAAITQLSTYFRGRVEPSARFRQEVCFDQRYATAAGHVPGAVRSTSAAATGSSIGDLETAHQPGRELGLR